MDNKPKKLGFVPTYAIFLASFLVLVPFLLNIESADNRQSYFDDPQTALVQDVKATIYGLDVFQESLSGLDDRLSFLNTSDARAATQLFANYVGDVNSVILQALALSITGAFTIRAVVRRRSGKLPIRKLPVWRWN